jgi:DNA (cytosine-5)-methyltransferase 1
LVSQDFAWAEGRLKRRLVLKGIAYESGVELASEPTDPLGAWWRSYLTGQRPHPSTNQRATLRVAELFSGSGGLALGFGQAAEELGFDRRSVMAVDQDEEALAIYRRRNDTRATSAASVASLVDYRVDGRGSDCRFLYEPEILHPSWDGLVGATDVLLAGPPCQGHSHLNNKTRFSDRRNELYLTVPAIGIALGVRVLIIENVRAVIHDRNQVVQSTETLLKAAGYDVTTGVVKAAELGWPQRRERFFLVARRDRSPLPIDQVAAGLRDDERDIWWAISDLADAPADGFMNMQPEFSPENVRRIAWLHDNDEHDLALSERPDCHKEGTTYNAVYGRLYKHKPAPTITTGFLTPGRGRYIHPTQRRVLTPREAARLQGFPDTFDFRPDLGSIPSKAKLTKWIGDAVPMPLGFVAGVAALGGGWE